MKKAAIIQPTAFPGKELREVLAASTDGWQEVRLLSTQDDEVGTVTDILGAAAFVERFDPDEVLAADVVFFCGSLESVRPLLKAWPAGAPLAVVLCPGAGSDLGPPVVSGLPLPPRDTPVVVSPHPAVVQLALLLGPLSALGLEQCVATVAQPASIHGEEGLDEVLDQATRLLAFQPLSEGQAFTRQIAFNLVPMEQDSWPMASQLEVLAAPRAPAIAVELVQAGVFHCLFSSLFLRFEPDPGTTEILAVLEESPHIVIDGEMPGPVESAQSDEVIVASLRQDPLPGCYWISSTMDNLTRGGALNAYEAAMRILEGRP